MALAGRPVCIDAVSRADVFAELWPRLLVGYAADAADVEPRRPPRRRDLIRALASVGCSARRRASGGDRHGLCNRAGRLQMRAIVHGEELVQLTAHID